MYIASANTIVPASVASVLYTAGPTLLAHSTYVQGSGGWVIVYNGMQFASVNIKLTTQYHITSLYLNGTNDGCTTNVYGSNTLSDYQQLTNQVPPNGTLLVSTYITNDGATVQVTNSDVYVYVIIIYLYRSTYTFPVQPTYIQINGSTGSNIVLTNGTDYTISTDSSTGYPDITYTDSPTVNVVYNELTLLLSEAYRRFFPVLRDSNNIVLGSWNIKNNTSSSNTLTYLYNGSTIYTLSTGGNTSQTGSHSCGALTCVGLSCANSLSLTNSGYAIGFQTGSLSQNSLYTLPLQVGALGSMLYVASYSSGANTLAFSSITTDSSGDLTASGSITSGSLTTGAISSSSNVTITGSMTSGSITTGAISSSSNVTITGSMTSGSVSTGGISASGNITCGNATLAGSLTSGSVTTGNITMSGSLSVAGAHCFSYNAHTFVNISMFSSGSYSMWYSNYSYIIDVTNATLNASVKLPGSLSNGATMYVQVTGTQSTYGIGITFDGTHYIYTGNGSFTVATSLTVGTTYICTFYGNSGNPWGSNYPSWTFSALSYNEIPLNNSYLNYFITSSYSDSIIGIFGINTSSLLNGQ